MVRYNSREKAPKNMPARAGFVRIACGLSVINTLASVCVASDKGVKESCFIAVHFAEGNTASIQLSNANGKQTEVTIERYSANGKLLDNIAKDLPATGRIEVRLDLSSPTQEFGWVRVLTKDKAVGVSMTLEVRRGDSLETLTEKAVYRHPEVTKQGFTAAPHKWTFDFVNNVGTLVYFVNLSEYSVQVGMCQDDVPNCNSPTLPYTVAPMASISFPIDHSRRYGVIESTPGYSVATALKLTEGTKQFFDASSCIKFGNDNSACAATPSPMPKSMPKYVSPIGQKAIENSEAAKSSPAAMALTPEELSERIKNGSASKCSIATEPTGADIYIDGLKAGIAPMVFVLVRRGDTPRIIEIRMAGYRTIEKRVVPDGQAIILGVNLEKQ